MEVLKVDFTAGDAPQEFTRSIKDTGFGVLTHHPLDMNLVKEVFDEWKVFFDLPEDEKRKFLYSNEGHDGFFPKDVSEIAKGETVADIKEYFHFYDWGSCPEHLRPKTVELKHQMEEVAKILLGWIQDNTPPEIQKRFSIPLPQMIEGARLHLLRILHYPPLTGNEPEGAVRAAAHGDINFITILPAATAQGLQVLDAEGNWHDVPCDPGSIAVNVGDMIEYASQGYYKSTIHRVCNPTGEAAKESRLSMPLFLHGAEEVQLTPEHTYGEMRLQRLRELGVFED